VSRVGGAYEVEGDGLRRASPLPVNSRTRPPDNFRNDHLWESDFEHNFYACMNVCSLNYTIHIIVSFKVADDRRRSQEFFLQRGLRTDTS